MGMNRSWKNLALGAAAGLAGTMVVQVFRLTDIKLLPESQPPIKDDPGRFMINKAKLALPDAARPQLPPATEALLSKLLAAGYGITFGALYAALRQRSNRLLVEGALLGLATWAVGYLGWLPATGLMPPVWKHKSKQIAAPIAEHTFYGLATVAGYRWLKQRFPAGVLA